MKLGIRKPNITGSIKAKTTGKLKRKVKSSINPLYGKKGMGLINDPKKSVYNKVYSKTSTGINEIISDKVDKNEKMNIVGSNNKIYNIINQDNVVISNKEYSKKNIKIFKNIFMFTAILLLFLGIICLPIGIIFILVGLLMFSMYRTYKEIYDEMTSFKKESNENRL